MKTPITSHQTAGRDERLVHNWRVERAHRARHPRDAGRGLRRPPRRWTPGRPAAPAWLHPAAGLAHHPLMSAPANRRQDAAPRRTDPALVLPVGTTDKAHPTARRHTGGRTDGGASRTADHSPA